MSGTDWDWTIGILIQCLVFISWCFDVYIGFMYLDVMAAIGAICTLLFFIFGPWCVSEYTRFLFEWIARPESFSSIYSRIRYDQRRGRSP